MTQLMRVPKKQSDVEQYFLDKFDCKRLMVDVGSDMLSVWMILNVPLEEGTIKLALRTITEDLWLTDVTHAKNGKGKEHAIAYPDPTCKLYLRIKSGRKIHFFSKTVRYFEDLSDGSAVPDETNFEREV